MMTEEYRAFFVSEVERCFGDPNKEISSFCGVPYEKENCHIEMDTRENMINMAMYFTMMPKESTNDGWEDIASMYLMDDLKRLGFEDSNCKIIRFVLCNPKFIPYVLWLTQGKPLCKKWSSKAFFALLGAVVAVIAGFFICKY